MVLAGHRDAARCRSGIGVGTPSEYFSFSPDLSHGLVIPFGSTPLPPLEEGAEQTIYVRDNEDGVYLPLVTAGNVPAGTKFGNFRDHEFFAATPDLSHVVIAL